MQTPKAFVLFLWLGTCVGAQAREESSELTFTLDGKKFEPVFIAVDGHSKRPREGDLIYVSRTWLRLGSERACHFKSTPREDGRLLLESNGKQTVVAATVRWTYKDDERISINPLADFSQKQIGSLWGLVLDDWPKGIESQLKHFNPLQTCLTVTDDVKQGGKKSLPSLPAGLRYLNIRESSNQGLREFDSLADQQELRILQLRLMTAKSFDLNLLAENRELRHLSISTRAQLDGLNQLSRLTQLRVLEFGGNRSLSDIAFARNLRELRRLDIGSTAVTDLSPLNPLTKLRSINANESQVKQLPTSEFADLQELRIFSAQVAKQDAEAFAKLHPRCKVYRGWTAALHETLADVTRIRVRSGGTCHQKGDEKTLLEMKDQAAVKEIIGNFAVEESGSDFHCGCCGEPTFEFYSEDKLIASLGFHHGRSLRWPGVWPADGLLTATSADSISDWLEKNGVKGPASQRRQEAKQKAAMQRRWERVLAVLPERVTAGLQKARSQDEAIKAFKDGVKDDVQRALVGFRMLGCDQGSWNHYTQFESIVTESLLPPLSVDTMSDAVIQSLKDKVAVKGAARWILGERKYKTIHADTLKQVLPALARIGLAHPRKLSRTETVEILMKIKSPEGVAVLRDGLNRKIKIEKLAEGEEAEPGGQVVYRPGDDDVNVKFSDAGNCAIALSKLGDKVSLSAIQKLSKSASGKEKAALEKSIQRLK